MSCVTLIPYAGTPSGRVQWGKTEKLEHITPKWFNLSQVQHSHEGEWCGGRKLNNLVSFPHSFGSVWSLTTTRDCCGLSKIAPAFFFHRQPQNIGTTMIIGPTNPESHCSITFDGLRNTTTEWAERGRNERRESLNYCQTREKANKLSHLSHERKRSRQDAISRKTD